MRRLVAVACVSAITILATVGCTQGGTVNSVRDYESAITESNALLAELQGHVPGGAIDRSDIVNADLDEDHHRLSCSDTTSQFTNAVNLWLTDGSDAVSIIEEIRDSLLDAGWTRVESVEEIETGTQGTEGSYTQNMRSSAGFSARLAKWTDDGQPGMSINVMSPCVANPSDKPDTWGR